MQIKKLFLTIFFVILIALMLLFSEQSLYFALTGLNLWFLKMIPTLLPFMILSGIMVRMNLTEYAAGMIYPVVSPLFRVSRNAVYCILMGFLCGFPMGAKVITELYERQRLSRREAEYLLSFCNNIGPIYFTGFVLPLIGGKLVFPYLAGMYGLPLLYGMFLRRTGYRDIPVSNVHGNEKKGKPGVSQGKEAIFYYVDDAINAAADSITGLGGYMILFNLLNLIPHTVLLLLHKTDEISLSILAAVNGLLEITSGISRMGNKFPLFILLLLPFGGFSCLAQTYSIIKRTDLSLTKYIGHKLCLTGLTMGYYALWYILSPGTFLK